jgi:hypothetical protein
MKENINEVESRGTFITRSFDIMLIVVSTLISQVNNILVLVNLTSKVSPDGQHLKGEAQFSLRIAGAGITVIWSLAYSMALANFSKTRLHLETAQCANRRED